LVLSASKLKTYKLCSQRYKYQYVDKLPSPKHPAAALGSAVHATIDKVFKQRQDPVSLFIQEFNHELHNYNISLDHLSYGYAKSLSDGIAMVGDYPFSSYTPKETEVEFWEGFPNDSSSIKIHGYIDQLYDWGIVDLKTNARKPKQEDLDNDLQFILYQWAFKKLTGSYPRKVLWYHLRTQEELAADVIGKEHIAEQAIDQIVYSLQEDLFSPVVGYQCKFCPFVDRCITDNGNIGQRKETV
jgi:hypothetical protein